MNKHDNKLTTAQARTALAAINAADIAALDNRPMIHETAAAIVSNLCIAFPKNYPADIIPALFAFVLSNLGRRAVREGIVKVPEYIAMIAEEKQENESSLRDFGAFGDLFEILARIALVKKSSLVSWRLLSVRDIMACDVVSRKYGRIEIGHNGKTLTFGTFFDYMAGDYDAVIYGVFSAEDKAEIYNLCKNGEYENAVSYISEYSALWENKYQFQHDMDNISRGAGITEKGGQIQVVFNPSKYDAFLRALENGVFPSLAETLKK